MLTIKLNNMKSTRKWSHAIYQTFLAICFHNFHISFGCIL